MNVIVRVLAAKYCSYDRELLAEIGDHPQFEILDLSKCESVEDIKALIPIVDATQYLGTPIVGVLRDGQWVESAWGYAGRMLARRMLEVLIR